MFHRFWNKKSEHCPETRFDISKQQRKVKKLDENDENKRKQKKHVLRLFANCGRPYNVNEAKMDFHLADEVDRYELDLHVYKYNNNNLLYII